MTGQLISGGIIVVIVVGIFLLMLWGWRRRRRRQAAIEPLPPVPADLAVGTGHPAKYVATTVAGDPYDRIAVSGLGFRGPATLYVQPEGLLVARDGEADVWIAKDRLLGIGRATWTIDRVVEARGLHLVRWRLGERELETYLRLDEPEPFDDALRLAALAQAPVPAAHSLSARSESKGAQA